MMNTFNCSWFMVMVVVVVLGVKAPTLGRCQPAEMGKIYDITHTLEPSMPAWNSPTGAKTIVNETWEPSETYYGTIKLNTHLGTHVDSPSHVFKDKITFSDVTSLDLSILNGPALVVETPKDVRNITAEVLTALNIPPNTKRVLLKTLNTFSGLWKSTPFTPNYAGLTPDGAAWIVSAGIKLIGIDYLSVAIYEEIVPVHQTLLKDMTIIPVEGLNLDGINPGTYNLHCLPLRIARADGSPARCILVG